MSGAALPALAAALLAVVQAAPQDHAARVDRFLAALPPSQARKDASDPFADERAERLLAANPGKEAAIRAAMEGRARCGNEASRAETLVSMRRTAEALTDDELDKLTAFYSGPDYKAMLAAGKGADLKALTDRYPLQRFMEASRREATEGMPDRLFKALDACETAANADLARAGVKID